MLPPAFQSDCPSKNSFAVLLPPLFILFNSSSFHLSMVTDLHKMTGVQDKSYIDIAFNGELLGRNVSLYAQLANKPDEGEVYPQPPVFPTALEANPNTIGNGHPLRIVSATLEAFLVTSEISISHHIKIF